MVRSGGGGAGNQVLIKQLVSQEHLVKLIHNGDTGQGIIIITTFSKEHCNDSLKFQ